MRRGRQKASYEAIEAQAAYEAGGSCSEVQGQQGPTGANSPARSWPAQGVPRRGTLVGAYKRAEDIELLIVEVEGNPMPEPRPRFDTRTGRVYVPSSAHDWKREIRKWTRVEMLRAGMTSAIPVAGCAWAVGFLFRFARPKSHYRTGRNAHLLKASAPQCHLGKPDLDNLIKAAKDALGNWDNRPALVWADDSQITTYIGKPHKRYCNEGEVAGLTLVVAPC